MSGSTFPIKATLYGHDQTRLEVDVALPVDRPDLTPNVESLKLFVQLGFNQFMPDIKHSLPMSCEYCGESARDAFLAFAAPSSGQTGKADIHAVCSMDGTCGAKAEKASKVLSNSPPGMMSIPQSLWKSRPGANNAPEEIKPKLGSCAKCNAEPSAETQLQKCSKCKLTVYCGAACQKEDWSRHKKNCKCITAVRFVDPEDKVNA